MVMANASKTAIVTMALLLGGCHQLMAQGDADSVSLRPSFGLDYTSELQTNFSRVKWVNLLELSAEVPLSRKFSFSLASLGGKTNMICVLPYGPTPSRNSHPA